MKRIIQAYRELLGIIWEGSPFLITGTFLASAMIGLMVPISIWVNSQIFNLGIEVASGALTFTAYIPWLVMFIIMVLLPMVLGMFIYSFVEPRSQLILRTAYKGKMLQKLKRLRYEHLESDASMKIIDSAYNGTENSARHLFPMYIYMNLTGIIASVGTLYMFGSVRWWLLLTLLIPFVLESWLAQKYYVDIYDELAEYWDRERQYGLLGTMLKSRDYIRENRLFQMSDFLIRTYRKRLHNRNRDYEKYYFRHLRRHFTGRNISRIAQIGNALILLWLYTQGGLNIGLLISLTLTIFSSLFHDLEASIWIFRYSAMHIKAFDFYDKYFALSEDTCGDTAEMPADCTIEFDDVYFSYPGTDKPVLQGLTFRVASGEKVSVVGENGEGKTTMVKLLLGLFQPDKGSIRIGGKPLASYSQEVRSRIFGLVFQDFVKYSISLGENVAVGDIAKIEKPEAIAAAMEKARADTVAAELPKGVETLLGRDFEGGVDISGGQWQRIAIARAFMGDKPILILDEPTSQLDPMAESRIYSEFAEMSAGKTAIFITHRLGSTMITDRILVIAGGKVTQSGSHEELMSRGGLYADMFNSQKQWYLRDTEAVNNTGEGTNA